MDVILQVIYHPDAAELGRVRSITTTDVVRDKVGEYGKPYIVRECNRQHPIRVVIALFQCIRIILKEKPDVVISTGAAPACMVCFLAKLLGARIIWMDSIANVERLSLSGRIITPFADLFLTQWPDLALRYRNVEFVGEVV